MALYSWDQSHQQSVKFLIIPRTTTMTESEFLSRKINVFLLFYISAFLFSLEDVTS
uniref:Uncharacterized protein n=1 Tax=Solanum tuberosum TaxID=4113 RepID=M1CN83_SOLTU